MANGGTSASGQSGQSGESGQTITGDGTSAVTGGSGDDILFAEPENTAAPAGGQGVFVIGDDGNDRLTGGHGDDVLIGGSGNDVLTGAAGDDDLVGGAGADLFVVGSGKDVISDFVPSQGDRVGFDTGEAPPDLFLHDTSQGTWIIQGSGEVTDPASQGVLLLGVHAASAAEAAGWFA